MNEKGTLKNVPSSFKTMNKTYIYDKNRYSVRITGIGYFSVLMLLYGIYMFITTFSVMYLAVVLICSYIIFETFITCANPNKVIITDKSITFEDPRHSDKYLWSEIKDFRVKPLPNRKQVYISINKDDFQLLKGRYWVFCLFFNDSDELYSFFLDKEAEIHPDTMKAKAWNDSKSKKKKES